MGIIYRNKGPYFSIFVLHSRAQVQKMLGYWLVYFIIIFGFAIAKSRHAESDISITVWNLLESITHVNTIGASHQSVSIK